jgi:hypothetical protein
MSSSNSDRATPHLWKACQTLFPIWFISIDVSFSKYMDANHMRKIVVRLVVEIVEDMRDTEKKKGWRVFQTPRFGKRIPLEKYHFFHECRYPCERDRQPNFKFTMKKDVLPIYWTTSMMSDLCGWATVFGYSAFSRCFGALCRAYGRIFRKSTSLLTLFYRQWLHIDLHKI